MTRTIEVASNAAASSWTNLTSVVPWANAMFGGVAHQCEVGTGAGFNLDDDAATRSLPAKRVFRVTESATTPSTVLMRGRISDKRVARGTWFAGDTRAFDTTVDDANAELRGIVVDGWSRPAETGYARIQALAAAFLTGSPRTSTNLDCTTYVPNTHTVTMPAKRYEQTDPAGVVIDCATFEGKQAFVTEKDELFYDLDTSTAYAASLSITDSSPNLSTSFPPGQPSGTQSGNEFYSGASMAYGTGSVSDVRTAAEAAHDYWRTALFDGEADATTATQRLASMLDNQSVEELRYECVLTLQPSQVDLIRKGQTVSFRSAAAAVLTPVTLRVAALYWEPVGVSTYRCHLELGVPQKLAGRVRHNRPVVPNDDEWVCIPTDFTVPWVDLGGGGGFAMITSPTWAGVQTATTVTTPSGGGYMTLYDGATYQLAASGHPLSIVDPITGIPSAYPHPEWGWLNNVGIGRAGGGDGSAFDMGAYPEGTVPGSPPLYSYQYQNFTMASTRTDMRGYVEAVNDVSHNSYLWTSFIDITYVSGTDPRYEGLGACTNGAPRVGQRVRQASFLGDGTTTAFTTDFPYTDGTLQVMVNGLDWTPDIATTETTTGDFTMTYPFPLDSTVVIRYRRLS